MHVQRLMANSGLFLKSVFIGLLLKLWQGLRAWPPAYFFPENLKQADFSDPFPQIMEGFSCAVPASSLLSVVDDGSAGLLSLLLLRDWKHADSSANIYWALISGDSGQRPSQTAGKTPRVLY